VETRNEPPPERIEVRRVADLTPDDMSEWEKLAAVVHPPGEKRLSAQLDWAPLESRTDYSIRLWSEGELRACAWVTQRAVTVEGRPTKVAGIRGVMTHPAYRRFGYGRLVMERAHALFADLGVDFGLLFSSEMAVPFYESLGWRRVSNPVTCEQPGGPIRYQDHIPASAPVMARMPSSAAQMPTGTIDLLGLPW
jgi:aminoglycoside 2'-N-acetyltransferase I